jgi:hypothetical protein
MAGSLLAGVAALAQPAAGAGDQAKLKVSFEDATIGEVLKVLAAAGRFQYTIPPQYQDRRVTVSLADVTPEEALQVVLNQAGLQAINDNGVWTVRPRSTARTGSSRGGGRAQTGVATGPAGIRQPPTVVAAAPTTTAATQATAAQWKREGEITRLLQIRYMDPGLMSMLYGGQIIYGDENLSGGSSGGQNGQNGQNGGNGNNGQNGNSNGNSSSGGYGGRSSGSSGGSSNRGY